MPGVDREGAMNQCEACGAHLLAEARFCMVCGARVSTGDEPAAPDTRGAPPQGAQAATGAAHPVRAGVGPKGAVRTMLLASLALIFLFFSPFVSCSTGPSNRTFTGLEAFQESLPSRYEDPKDGVLLILFPIMGITGTLVSLLAQQRISAGQSLRSVRGFAVGGLLSGLVALCPVGVGIYDSSQSNGVLNLLWGFWLSTAAAIALGGASLLLLVTPDPPLTTGASPPQAGGQLEDHRIDT